MESETPLTRVILVRHGDSVHKAERTTGGPRGCKGLTPLGRRQTEKLRDRLSRDKSLGGPVRLYASWLPRAVETAEILAPALGGVPVTTDANLVSWIVPPEWDGKTWEEYQRLYTQTGGGVFRPFETKSKSWAELVARVGRILTEIVQRHPGETVLIVTHAEAIDASLRVWGGLPFYPAFDVKAANASLTEWRTTGDVSAFPPARWTLIRFNDAAHLE